MDGEEVLEDEDLEKIADVAEDSTLITPPRSAGAAVAEQSGARKAMCRVRCYACYELNIAS